MSWSITPGHFDLTTTPITLHRHSIAKRVPATLTKIKENLQKRRHRPIGENGRWLWSVVQGRLTKRLH
jgi:hypothetical protein